MNIRYYFKLLILLCVLVSCSGEADPDPRRLGHDFFPLQTGAYIDYEVEDIDYNIQGTIDTANYELRVMVADSFVSQSGDLRYEIHRLTRESAMDNWQFQTAWTAYVNGYNAVQIEENIPFIKLSFPLVNGLSWNANAMNIMDEDIYTADSLDFTFITGSDSVINNTVTVVQNDNQEFITQQDKRYEIYARHIGLIKKEELLFNYCTDDDCLGQQIIENGRLYKQEYITHGQN